MDILEKIWQGVGRG